MSDSLRPPEPVSADDPRIEAMRHLLGVIDRLRAPDGCPWDLEQTEASMAPCLIEEAHELQEAIENESPEARASEAGDVLMNVALIARIAEQEGSWDLADATNDSVAKLVRRHPHVFGDLEAADTGEVLRNWEAIKRQERGAKGSDDSAVAGVPKALPALQRAARLAGKAAQVGFQWDSVGGAFDKLVEEFGELSELLPESLLAGARKPELEPEHRARLEHELGDLLLAGSILGRYLGLDAEAACRAATRRFEGRFRVMEENLRSTNPEQPFEGLDEDGLRQAWTQAKADPRTE
ncbi:MAG: MazG family protein [Planctomycetota bacterium]